MRMLFSFYSVLDPNGGTVLTMLRAVLPTLRNTIWKIPHGPAQRLASEAILDLLRLTSETSPARFLPLAALPAPCSEIPQESQNTRGALLADFRLFKGYLFKGSQAFPTSGSGVPSTFQGPVFCHGYVSVVTLKPWPNNGEGWVTLARGSRRFKPSPVC